MNPYDWQRNTPQVIVPRRELAPVLQRLRRGGSAVILGGRGMGKSVLLQQIQTAASEFSKMRVVLIAAPPPKLTVEDCLHALARNLGVAAGDAISAREILDRYRMDHPDSSLILLFDELDRYAQGPVTPASQAAGRHYFNDLETARRNLPWLGIAAAGSIGVFVFRDVLGSSFLARAEQFRLSPFRRTELSELAHPFAETGQPLDDEILDALFLASGGNPALATFGLETLWEQDSPEGPSRIAEIYTEFQERFREFLRDVERSFSDPALSQAPQRVWSLIQHSGGPVSRAALQEACRTVDGTLLLDVVDILYLLSASGLVRLEGSPVNDDPVAVWPVTSILTLPQLSASGGDFRERFLADLKSLLGRMHAGSADFFRVGGPGTEKQLVHEAVFAGFLALGFALLGWQVEREAQQAAGRTDLKIRRNGGREIAVVEVKVWGRNDFREVHRQIESYWTKDAAAGAVVMLTDREIPDWPETYRSQCLTSLDVLPELVRGEDSPIQAQISYRSTTPDGLSARLDHFLLRLPRR